MNRALDDRRTALFIRANGHKYKKATLRRVLEMPDKERMAWIDAQEFTLQEQIRQEERDMKKWADNAQIKLRSLMKQIQDKVVESRLFANSIFTGYKQGGLAEAERTYMEHKQYAESMQLSEHLDQEWNAFLHYIKQQEG